MKDLQSTFTYTNNVAFPLTEAVDSTTGISLDGTEFKAAMVNDFWGWMQALLSTVGVTPDGNQEASGASQIVDAIKAIVNRTAPVGKVEWLAASTAPTGWLKCEGQSLLRADYPALFAIIGTTWGTVDGTHFTLPDLRGRFLRGAGTDYVGNPLVVGNYQNPEVGAHAHNVGTYPADGTPALQGIATGGGVAEDTHTTEVYGAGTEPRPMGAVGTWIIFAQPY